MRRLPHRFPAVLLGLAIVFAAVGVTEAWRAARSNQTTTEGLLRDYGAMAAWTFGERAVVMIDEAIRSVLMPVWQRASAPAGVDPFHSVSDFRQHARRDHCRCGRTFDAAFYFRLRIDLAVAEFAGRQPQSHVAAAMVDAVMADVPRLRESAMRRPFGVVSAGGTTFAYTIHAGAGEQLTAWGFSLDPAAVADRVGEIMTSCALLPPVLIDGRPNHETVAVALIAPDGQTLFEAGTPDPRLATEHRLHANYGGLLVRASVLPALANDLIIGGLPRSRVPLMLGVFALAVVLAGVAIAQLRRAQELARLRSDFVAGVSHELRTPLAQIRVYADTLALGRAQEEDRRIWTLDGLRRETTRLEHLVDNILHFTRTERPETDHAPHAIDMGAACSRAVEAFTPLIARRASVDLVVEEGLFVRIATESLRQILGNLLDNAVKYGPRGQTVRIRAARAGARARILVEDQGPGVPRAAHALVWEMYRRGTNAIGSEVGGSGIGLAVVRRIVEAHHGRAWIENNAAGGARFLIELPVEPLPSPARAVMPSRDALATAAVD